MTVSKKKSKKDPNAPKEKGLFDHVKHIRQGRNPDYISTLSDSERKSFNHYMILKALSMDPNLIEDVAMLYMYFDKIPTPQFYTLLLALVPPSRQFFPWIKGKKQKYKKELLEWVGKRFEVSKQQAVEYANILMATDSGMTTLVGICQGYGLTEKEVEKLFTDKDDE